MLSLVFVPSLMLAEPLCQIVVRVLKALIPFSQKLSPPKAILFIPLPSARKTHQPRLITSTNSTLTSH